MTIKEDITWRTALVYLLVVVIAVGVVMKAFAVMTIEGEKWRKMAAPGNIPVRPVKVAPSRGDICAADGRILATSVPFYELRFDPVAVDKKIFQEQVDSLALCLSQFFGDGSKAYYKQHRMHVKHRQCDHGGEKDKACRRVEMRKCVVHAQATMLPPTSAPRSQV